MRISVCVLILVTSVNLQFEIEEMDDISTQKSCRSIQSCRDCKKSDLECEWCHNLGCTKFPHLYCPKKILLTYLFNNKNNIIQHDCTKIVTKGPLFIPANIRRVISLEIVMDDVTIFKEEVLCVIQIEHKLIELHGFLINSTVFCDSISLQSSRSVALGSIYLRWQSVEPFSNRVLIIVYNCQKLAQSCDQCQILNKRFNCGWCDDSSMCTLTEECPKGYAAWTDDKYKCPKTETE